jgi:hypothetical protein
MMMTKMFAPLAALAAAVTASPVNLGGPSTTAAYCTSGEPVVTAGYTINYAPAAPTAVQSGVGYKPEAVWANDHIAATYVSGLPNFPLGPALSYHVLRCSSSFLFFSRSVPDLPRMQCGKERQTNRDNLLQTYGVPEPKETGFAYAQFKCQYTCNSAPGGSSFFVEYGK